MKTSELEGIALDWAVAWANGNITIKNFSGVFYLLDGDVWNPSTDWAQGGPIIEREGISVLYQTGVRMTASINGQYEQSVGHRHKGNIGLLAAMRCYVASKLGPEVDVPEEVK